MYNDASDVRFAVHLLSIMFVHHVVDYTFGCDHDRVSNDLHKPEVSVVQSFPSPMLRNQTSTLSAQPNMWSVLSMFQTVFVQDGLDLSRPAAIGT